MARKGVLFRLAGMAVLDEDLDQVDRLDAVPDELRGLLAEVAGHFLAGGGRLSLEDWENLLLVERAAFVAAGRRIDVEQATRTRFRSASGSVSRGVGGGTTRSSRARASASTASSSATCAGARLISRAMRSTSAACSSVVMPSSS